MAYEFDPRKYGASNLTTARCIPCEMGLPKRRFPELAQDQIERAAALVGVDYRALELRMLALCGYDLADDKFPKLPKEAKEPEPQTEPPPRNRHERRRFEARQRRR